MSAPRGILEGWFPSFANYGPQLREDESWVPITSEAFWSSAGGATLGFFVGGPIGALVGAGGVLTLTSTIYNNVLKNHKKNQIAARSTETPEAKPLTDRTQPTTTYSFAQAQKTQKRLAIVSTILNIAAFVTSFSIFRKFFEPSHTSHPISNTGFSSHADRSMKSSEDVQENPDETEEQTETDEEKTSFWDDFREELGKIFSDPDYGL